MKTTMFPGSKLSGTIEGTPAWDGLVSFLGELRERLYDSMMKTKGVRYYLSPLVPSVC